MLQNSALLAICLQPTAKMVSFTFLLKQKLKTVRLSASLEALFEPFFFSSDKNSTLTLQKNQHSSLTSQRAALQSLSESGVRTKN